MSHTQNYLESVTLEEVEVETLVNYIVLDSVEAGASDIHIEPWEETVAVRVRIAGVLTELIHLPLDLREKLPGRFKVMGSMQSHVSGIGQDGKANMGPEFGNIQLRISILPTILGEKVVCRVFDPSSRSFDINQLGFEPQTLTEFVDLLNKPNGLILLNGPTGSGKTTAMYSALMYLIQKHGTTMSIATVEDPVEVPLATIAQVRQSTRPIIGRDLINSTNYYFAREDPWPPIMRKRRPDWLSTSTICTGKNRSRTCGQQTSNV